MTKLYTIVLLTSLITFSGCTSLKEKTGEYITEAVREKIVADIGNLLDKRGLSIQEIKDAADSDNDKNLTKKEIVDTVKDMTRDYVLLETKDYVEGKIKDAEERIKSTKNSETHSKLSQIENDIVVKFNEFWIWFLGLIATYLGKQIYSAKKDGKRDERIAVLEKITGKDLDGDGKIGSNGTPIVQNESKLA